MAPISVDGLDTTATYGTETSRWVSREGTSARRARKAPLFKTAWVVEFLANEGPDGWLAVTDPFEAPADAAALHQERVKQTGLTSRYRFREEAVSGDTKVTPPGGLYGLRQTTAPSKHPNFLQIQENPSKYDF